MDFRQYKMHHTDGLITFDIQPTKEMSLEIERIKKETKQIIPLDVNIIDNLIADIEANDYSLNKTLDTLKEQYNLLTIHQDNPLIGQYITKFVKLLSIILNLKQINKDERTDICNY
ncbi:MAG: hypothetical protein MJ219_00430 [Mycoplasmoidaceae bacterium]|nr:hypothetical protein [Mycoplasmoidaceae bacterium]